MPVHPYVFFDGRCEEALAFYERALGAEVTMKMRFSESPEPQYAPPGGGDKIMHAALRIGDTVLMASDGMCRGSPEFKGISLSFTAKSAAEADRTFAALADGGAVQMPLGETFFAVRFGMVADRFGVSWMIIADKPMPAPAKAKAKAAAKAGAKKAPRRK